MRAQLPARPGTRLWIIAASGADDAADWGLRFRQAARRPAADACIFWRADWDASVLAVEALPTPPGDADAFGILSGDTTN